MCPRSSALGFLGCWGSWGLTGPWASWGFQSGARIQGLRSGELAGLHRCEPHLLTACQLPAHPGPPTLTLGFFTPLPLGCSSESCRFRGLFSARGVSTKLESWGRGVAFSPKGSDWWSETSRVATRAGGFRAPVLRVQPPSRPYSYSLEKSIGPGAQKEHWALLLQLCAPGQGLPLQGGPC